MTGAGGTGTAAGGGVTGAGVTGAGGTGAGGTGVAGGAGVGKGSGWPWATSRVVAAKLNAGMMSRVDFIVSSAGFVFLFLSVFAIYRLAIRLA